MTRLPPALVLALGAAALGLPGAAFAQDGADPVWTVEGSVGAVSDYRYRGYSLSDGDPALQGGLTVSHSGGFYGDLWLSTIDEYGIGSDGDGARVEATVTLGWAGAIGGLDVDVGVSTYQYPDGTDVAYSEIPVQIGQTRGAVTWTLGAAWAPDGQTALGDADNRYVWGGLDVAPDAWPVSLRGTVGYEDGAWAPGGKTDWLVGLALPVGPATLGLDYVDSDVDDSAVVLSLFVGF